jgi:cell division protein FtsQ
MMPTSSSSKRPAPVRNSSLSDRSSVRGVKRGKTNRRRQAVTPKQRVFSAVKLVSSVAIAATVGFGLASGYKYLTTSPTFSIAEIEVAGNQRASVESIEKLSGVSLGENVFLVDTNVVVRTVEAHPWVAGAIVERKFPHGLKITVSEHQPIALVALGHLYYADKNGEIVKRYAPGEKEVLPVITGLSRAQIETDDGEARYQLVKAIEFLDAFAKVSDAPKLAEIHLDPVLGLSFVEAETQTMVVVGEAPWAPRLERWQEVRAALDEKSVKASRIMLGGERRRDRVVARLEKVEEPKKSLETARLTLH